MRRSCFIGCASPFALAVVAGCGGSEAVDDDLRAIRPPEIARIAPAEEAIRGAFVPTLDPATMNGAEIEKAIGAGPRCQFRYTSAGDPVLGVTAAQAEPLRAVVKLNGHLVVLGAADAPQGLALAAEPIRVSVEPDRPESAAAGESVEATMIFEVERELHVGYRGYYDCLS